MPLLLLFRSAIALGAQRRGTIWIGDFRPGLLAGMMVCLGTGACPAQPASGPNQFADLPVGLTSFGAAVLGDNLYVYGGHTGEAHAYSVAEQSGELRRLRLTGDGGWETISQEERLQGLALVAHGDRLIRIGGFTARNEEGADHDLWSTAAVRRYDPQAGVWEELPALPEPRSSLDAVVLANHLYVVGGWELSGGDESRWHDTAWSLDLTADSPVWKSTPQPPFRRRAIALAVHAGKVHAIGGMDEAGPTNHVAILDPESQRWETGPDLPGKPFEGFGASAWSTGGKLYVSTNQGRLFRLSDDGNSWERIQKLKSKRLFHRMVPFQRGLLLVGGVNMEEGKYLELEWVGL
ncbi:MAG TPA: hypothetical protein VIY86_13630 [Pirellulaceae bacterium]